MKLSKAQLLLVLACALPNWTLLACENQLLLLLGKTSVYLVSHSVSLCIYEVETNVYMLINLKSSLQEQGQNYFPLCIKAASH